MCSPTESGQPKNDGSGPHNQSVRHGWVPDLEYHDPDGGKAQPPHFEDEKTCHPRLYCHPLYNQLPICVALVGVPVRLFRDQLPVTTRRPI
jgi:hypothetical protein